MVETKKLSASIFTLDNYADRIQVCIAHMQVAFHVKYIFDDYIGA
jgi:hypothetical protein